MKKKYILIIIIIFGIILIPKNTYALDFSVNGTTYQVEDLETFRDYMYFEKYKNNNSNANNIYVFYNSNVNAYFGYLAKTYIYKQIGGDTLATKDQLNTNYGADVPAFRLNSDNTTAEFTTSQLPINSNYMSSVNICTSYQDCNTYYDNMNANFTFNDIECKYNTGNGVDCPSDNPGDEPTEPEEPSQDNTTNENVKYIKTGLVMIGVFIMFIFIDKTFHIKKERL